MKALQLYRATTALLAPAILLFLLRRRARGKEDPERFGERLGRAVRPRPPGRLVWLHAASVGEATSLLALVERLRRDWPMLSILLTTGTVTSARLLERRLPRDGAVIHQFVPVDRLLYVRRFLDHWRPDLAIWVESELWPNLVLETHARGVRMVLVNARMSKRSFARWQRWPALIEALLSSFDLCFAQDEVQGERLAALGARGVEMVGDLKAAAPPLPADPRAAAELAALVGDRPVWLAASTHPGEEDIAAATHRLLQERVPGLLTVIVPRHPARAGEIATTLGRQGFSVVRRSLGERPDAKTDIYLGDTLGELGLFYRCAGIVLVGGSLTPVGGHNPLEPAVLDCAILHGPDMANCAAVARDLQLAGGAAVVRSPAELAERVGRLLAHPAERERMAQAAEEVAARHRGVLDALLGRLAPLLDEAAPERDRARA